MDPRWAQGDLERLPIQGIACGCSGARSTGSFRWALWMGEFDAATDSEIPSQANPTSPNSEP